MDKLITLSHLIDGIKAFDRHMLGYVGEIPGDSSTVIEYIAEYHAANQPATATDEEITTMLGEVFGTTAAE